MTADMVMTREVTACSPPQLAVMVGGQLVRLPSAHPSVDRIDLVVLAMQVLEDRRPEVEVLTGVPATSPACPASTSNWCRVESPLAQVLVRAGGHLITQTDIYPPGADVPIPRPLPNVSAGDSAATSFFPIMPLRLEPSRPPLPPKREVLTVEAGLYSVVGWCLATFDRILAEAVAREFDRIDPLPARVDSFGECT